MSVIIKSSTDSDTVAVIQTNNQASEVLVPSAHHAFAGDLADIKSLEVAESALKSEMKDDLRTRVRMGTLFGRIRELCALKPEAFYEHCMTTFGFEKRRVQFYMQVAEYLENSGVTLEALAGASWSQIRLLAQRVDAGQLVTWVEKLPDKTVIGLLSDLSKQGHPSEDDPSAGDKLKVTFPPEQAKMVRLAIEKAKAKGEGIKSDAFAIEMICLDFLAANSHVGT